MIAVMMTITEEDYESEYWPKLENAINQLLTMTPGEYIPISYEQMYRYGSNNSPLDQIHMFVTGISTHSLI